MEITTRRKTIEKISGKGEGILLTRTKKRQSSSSELIEKYNPVSSTGFKENKTKRAFQFLKRISPFLLLGFFLVGLFPYMFLTGVGTIHNVFLLMFAFIFLEVNILYGDFALWNYFEGKKIFRIWLIEVPLAFLVIYFLI